MPRSRTSPKEVQQLRAGQLGAGQLRAEVHARGLRRAQERPGLAHEVGYGAARAVIYERHEEAGHGNFLAASYRRICARPEWAARLGKTYTGSRWLPRAGDRWRGELECATSSDALLMNVFCYPGMLRRKELCALLGVEAGLRPEFGVRAHLRMRGGEVDRTELDMRVGDVLVEAKLTEGGFGVASRERLLRYEGVQDVFDLDLLPRSGPVRSGWAGYQLVRGLLAAQRSGGSYLLLLDARRSDLEEICFRVLAAVSSAEVRSRLRLHTWQEIAAVTPSSVRDFLEEKYGVVAV